jgi:hypothetical protein
MPLGPNNRKILELNSPGLEDTLGGDDYDILTLWHENTDLTAGAYAGVPHKSTVNTPTEFRDNKLRFLNPAQTKTISVRTLGFTDNYDLTIPLLTASDTLLTISHPAQIYGKTISIDDNPIIATGISSGDLLKSNGTRFLKMARGLPGQVLTVKNDGLDLEWTTPATGTGGSSTPADNSVTTAKIVDAAVTNVKLAGSITGSKLLDDAITTSKIIDGAVSTAKIPDSAITNAKLAGSITGSKLANSTITGTQLASTTVTNSHLAGSISNDKLLQITDTAKLPASIRYDWSVAKYGGYTLTTANGGEGIFNGILQSTGTHSIVLSSPTGNRAKFTTGAASGNTAGVRSPFVFTKRDNNPKIYFKYSTTNNTSLYVFAGFTTETTGFMTAGDPLNAKHGIGLWINSDSTNVRSIRNDGTGGSIGEDILPTTTLASLGTHSVILTANDAAGTFTLSFDGTNNTYSTDIPSSTQDLTFQVYVITRTAAARELDIRHLFFLGQPA